MMEIPGYRLDKKIGEGGMSEVYLAEQLSLHRTVAIKFLSEELLNHHTALELFENEPLIVARLNHPKIIHVIDKGITDDGKPFFIMEYVKGTTLHDLVQDQNVATSQKIGYLIQVCRGLSFAHKNGIIHRDIKPANIIIDEENNARILDFGIASFYTDDRFVQKNASKVLGTERYMSPEVKISSANASLLSDVYSLGVLMFEIFSENFVDEVKADTIKKHNIPSPIRKLILECLQKDPSSRPTSTSVIENRLLQIIKGAHLALSQKANAEKDLSTLASNFDLLDELSHNEYGSLYLYAKKNSHQLIAIKKRQQDASGLREAKLLTTLKHPNIINIHGTGSNSRSFIVVMEYMDAGSLAERLMQSMSLERFFPIAHQVLEGLKFAHQNRILHSNLRPSNILFNNQGCVKISDFGQSEHYAHQETSSNWYHPQAIEPSSQALDIFALGAIFYHMLTGETITWSNGQIAWKENYSILPYKIQQWLLSMLALDPEYRVQQVAEISRELERIQNLPKSALKPQDKFSAIGFKRKAAKTFSYLALVRKFGWILIFGLMFTYLQIYLFFPEFKQFLHLTLHDFLIWWAKKLI